MNTKHKTKPKPAPVNLHNSIATSCPLPYSIGQIVDSLGVPVTITDRAYKSGRWFYQVKAIDFQTIWSPEDGWIPHSWLLPV